MAAVFQYQKLKPESAIDAGADDYGPHYNKVRFRPIFLQRNPSSSSRVWARLRARRRLRFRVRGLRWFLRRRARLVAAAVRKVVRRLKEGQGHFGDLFAGNYLFLQVNPSTPAAVAAAKKKFAAAAAYRNPPRSVA